MGATTFDKLAYSEALKAGGFSHEQATVQANALDAALRESVATRHDIELLRSELRQDIRDSEVRMIRWLIPLLLGQAALVAALVKLL